MTDPVSADLDAWIRVPVHLKPEADRRYQVLARRINPNDPLYDPLISNKQLAQAAGEDEASVCRWLKQWEKGITGPGGEIIAPPRCKAALAPRRHGPSRGRTKTSKELAQEIIDLAAEHVRSRGKPLPIPSTLVHKTLVAKGNITGEPAPSFARVRHILRGVSYQDLLGWAGGHEELKKSGGLPRLVVVPPPLPNVEWYGDQWVADVFVVYEDGIEGRPVVFSYVDRFGGGFVTGLVIHRRFTGHTVTEALLDGIRRQGRPGTLRIDLGRENRTKRLRSGCQALGTNLFHTTPHDPAVKGLQEHTHAAFREFCSRLPWYAPSDIRTKPLRDQPILTFAEFCGRFEVFVFGEYNLAPYAGIHAEGKKSRLDLRQATAFTPIRVPEDELQVLFAEAKLVTVWPQGIKLHGLIYFDPALGTRIGQKVWARQGRTDTEVIVHDEEMHLVCTANNALAEAAGMDDEKRRQFTTDRRTLAKAITTQADERIRRARSRPDWLLLEAQRRMAEQGDAPPRPSVRQMTPATHQTPVAAQAGTGRRLKLFRRER